MPKKKRPPAKAPLSDKTRASDDALRDALRNADLAKFDRVLSKAIRPSRRG